MAKKLYEESNISAIAAAIRTRSGSQDTYKTEDMASAITSIPTATLITKNISANATYNASSDGADGYSQVVVNVPGEVLPNASGQSF